METIKKYASLISAALIAILSALLFRQNRKTDEVQSELNQEKTSNEIKGNEHDRKIAADIAADLLAEYERSKR